ncbi:hypothetical protein HYH03_007995 [Edaphochlamys debaryana]|uniref:Uncharacterized protein n=1 Tax=Edaphochlamys debaryana TaxID=47281 RepID=A0A835Y7D3_9CHLO|nr:hypothetical protein HYH03_007995 [Edaphochlamys debaryana]|eukprot:KAG2493775.1 hypothetical protein HYH03_007995 [Edaphochlamys debaryana]
MELIVGVGEHFSSRFGNHAGKMLAHVFGPLCDFISQQLPIDLFPDVESKTRIGAKLALMGYLDGYMHGTLGMLVTCSRARAVQSLVGKYGWRKTSETRLRYRAWVTLHSGGEAPPAVLRDPSKIAKRNQDVRYTLFICDGRPKYRGDRSPLLAAQSCIPSDCGRDRGHRMGFLLLSLLLQAIAESPLTKHLEPGVVVAILHELDGNEPAPSHITVKPKPKPKPKRKSKAAQPSAHDDTPAAEPMVVTVTPAAKAAVAAVLRAVAHGMKPALELLDAWQEAAAAAAVGAGLRGPNDAPVLMPPDLLTWLQANVQEREDVEEAEEAEVAEEEEAQEEEAQEEEVQLRLLLQEEAMRVALGALEPTSSAGAATCSLPAALTGGLLQSSGAPSQPPPASDTVASPALDVAVDCRIASGAAPSAQFGHLVWMEEQEAAAAAAAAEPWAGGGGLAAGAAAQQSLPSSAGCPLMRPVAASAASLATLEAGPGQPAACLTRQPTYPHGPALNTSAATVSPVEAARAHLRAALHAYCSTVFAAARSGVHVDVPPAPGSLDGYLLFEHDLIRRVTATALASATVVSPTAAAPAAAVAATLAAGPAGVADLTYATAVDGPAGAGMSFAPPPLPTQGLLAPSPHELLTPDPVNRRSRPFPAPLAHEQPAPTTTALEQALAPAQHALHASLQAQQPQHASLRALAAADTAPGAAPIPGLVTPAPVAAAVLPTAVPAATAHMGMSVGADVSTAAMIEYLCNLGAPHPGPHSASHTQWPSTPGLIDAATAAALGPGSGAGPFGARAAPGPAPTYGPGPVAAPEMDPAFEAAPTPSLSNPAPPPSAASSVAPVKPASRAAAPTAAYVKLAAGAFKAAGGKKTEAQRLAELRAKNKAAHQAQGRPRRARQFGRTVQPDPAELPSHKPQATGDDADADPEFVPATGKTRQVRGAAAKGRAAPKDQDQARAQALANAQAKSKAAADATLDAEVAGAAARAPARDRASGDEGVAPLLQPPDGSGGGWARPGGALWGRGKVRPVAPPTHGDCQGPGEDEDEDEDEPPSKRLCNGEPRGYSESVAGPHGWACSTGPDGSPSRGLPPSLGGLGRGKVYFPQQAEESV